MLFVLLAAKAQCWQCGSLLWAAWTATASTKCIQLEEIQCIGTTVIKATNNEELFKLVVQFNSA